MATRDDVINAIAALYDENAALKATVEVLRAQVRELGGKPRGEEAAAPPEDEPRAEIRFVDKESRTELVPASPLGDGLFRVLHGPSFAFGISARDVVRAAAGEDGVLAFDGVVTKSGNRTVRVLLTRFSADSDRAKALRAQIEGIGCDCVNNQPFVLTINVPEAVELKGVAGLLISQGLWWEYADPTREELHPPAQ